MTDEEIDDEFYANERENERAAEHRVDLYLAIVAGDIREARTQMDLMAMIGIDREEIETARRLACNGY